MRQLCLLQSVTRWYYKVRQLFYYKVRQALLQSATGITKCDKCYYKVWQVLQSATLLQSVTVQLYISCEWAMKGEKSDWIICIID